LAEGWNPDLTRAPGGRSFSPPGRCAFAIALIAAFPISTAIAQDALGVIEQRIESTFQLVIGNSPELAIPLTRRALQRRSDEIAIDPLAYGAGQAPAVAEEVSAEGDADLEEEVARLPRPRPDRVREQAAEAEPEPEPEATDAPLDLVAGAALVEPETVVAANALQQTGSLPSPSVDQPILPAAATSEPLPELVATGSCLSPSDVADKDGDFKRNAELLSGNAFCIAEKTFRERRRTWTIQTIRTSRPGPLWAVMHDDEDMSFDNAVEALKAYGGTFVTVDTGGKRNLDGIDPNRNFSADNIGCAKLGKDAAPEYTAFFRALISDEPIIALHNNYNGHVPTGGLGHVTMESVPKDMRGYPASDPSGPLASERNLVLLTSAEPVSATAESRARALAEKGVNAMIEIVSKGDCSLSNDTLLTGHPDYLNVTVDHDQRNVQRQIIDVIMAGRNATVATQ
jgi:hypothetical protein